MALAILDGTQTATTLSTILSSGQHITAHTVVSLGTQAKTDILSAVSSGIAISGTVTANLDPNSPVISSQIETGIASYAADLANDPLPIFGTVTANVGNAVVIQVVNAVQDGDGTTFGVDRNFPVDISSALPAGTNRIGVVTIGAGTVTIGAGTAQIGSVTASLAISATAITSGSFASLTSATLVPGNVARKMATVFNQGAGQLFVNAGATATTLGGGFMVALSSGDFYECDYTTTTLSAIFATAGTASWVSH